jgi:hypothetical protein
MTPYFGAIDFERRRFHGIEKAIGAPEGHVRFRQAAHGTGRELEKLARSLFAKATLLVTALLILSLHRMLEYYLSAVPLVPTLLNWGAILVVAWVLVMQIIDCAGYLVEAISDLVVEILRSIRRVGDYWRQE